jgi:integrase
MSGVFEHAVATLRADTDPVWPVRKALPPNKTQHKRALSAEEVGQLLNDFDGHGGNFQTIKAFQLMWLTLSRPNESVQAEWVEFDLEKALWTIPARRMKARREHVVPLPTQRSNFSRPCIRSRGTRSSFSRTAMTASAPWPTPLCGRRSRS